MTGYVSIAVGESVGVKVGVAVAVGVFIGEIGKALQLIKFMLNIVKTNRGMVNERIFMVISYYVITRSALVLCDEAIPL